MITIYTTATCTYCKTVKRFFDLKGVEYTVEDITDDPIMRQALHKTTGYSTVPVTTDGTDYVIGWQPAQLAKLIKK